MSIRPRNMAAARLARAQARMAPGGRRWSESPIPRPGTVRRARAVGMPTPPSAGYEGGNSGSLATTSATSLTMDSSAAADGQVAIVVAHAADVVVSAPSGWTVVASGTSGDLSYVIAWTTESGSTDYTLTATGTGYDPSTYYGHIAYTLSHWTVDTTVEVVASVSTATGAGSFAPIYPSHSWAARHCIVAALDAVGYVTNIYSAAAITRPSTSWAYYGVTGGAGYRTHQGYRLRPIPGNLPSPDLFTSTEPTNTDWVGVAVGIVAA